MVSSNASALGVIFANTYDNLVPELVAERTMASIPFGGRYRMIDFVLSSMANSGIDNVSIIVRRNYHSLMDHLGAGREWDLTRKRGGLNVFPPMQSAASRFTLAVWMPWTAFCPGSAARRKSMWFCRCLHRLQPGLQQAD